MKFYGVDVLANTTPGEWPQALEERAVTGLLQALPDGVALASLDGKFQYINRSFERLAGISLEDATDQQLLFFARSGGILAGIAASLERAKSIDTTGELANGRRVAASLRILRDENDIAYGGILLIRDLSELAVLKDKRPEKFRIRGDGFDTGSTLVVSPQLDELLKQGAAALGRNARLMLTGESGTGKTELARRLSDRVSCSGAPFVHVNCGGIPESLFESEMFGYDSGAFTGAASRGKPGYVEVADGGVLFLDEVGEIPLHVQAKLLTFLEDGSYLRVGSASRRRVTVKVVSATNRSLSKMIKQGAFRRDLYYRLAVVTLQLPALRGQKNLITQLVQSHLARINQSRQPALSLSPEFTAALLEHSYPGNIRELGNILEHAAATANKVAGLKHLPDLFGGVTPDDADADGGSLPIETMDRPLKDMVRDFESLVLERAIARHGSKRQAAKVLGVDIGTVVRKTKRADG